MKKSILIFSFIAVAGIGFLGFRAFSDKSLLPDTIESHALLPEYSKQEMIRQSDAIVLATVVETSTGIEPSSIRQGSDDVVTTATLKVDSYLRNYSTSSSSEIMVQTLGGTFANTTMSVDGSAILIKGERVLVFLSQKDDKMFTVYGWAQGKYTLGQDGTIGVNEEEIAHFKKIFGDDRSINAMREAVAQFNIVSPKGTSSDIIPGPYNTSDKNTEAQKILDGQ